MATEEKFSKHIALAEINNKDERLNVNRKGLWRTSYRLAKFRGYFKAFREIKRCDGELFVGNR